MYLLPFLFALVLFILDFFFVTFISLFIFNSILFLKIKSIYKQNTINFLNEIKGRYDYAFPTTFVGSFVGTTLIALIVYLFMRASLFYVLQMQFNLMYSIPTLYFLLIPFSFYFGAKKELRNIIGITNTLHFLQRDIPVGEGIQGFFAFFIFKEESKFYNFLKKISVFFLKTRSIIGFILVPILIIVGGVVRLALGESIIEFIVALISGLSTLSLFHLYKRNLEFSKFSALSLILLLISVVIALFKVPTEFAYILISAIALQLLNTLRYKRRSE